LSVQEERKSIIAMTDLPRTAVNGVLDRLILEVQADIPCVNPSETCYCRVCTINWHGDNDHGNEPPPCHGKRLCTTCEARRDLAKAGGSSPKNPKIGKRAVLADGTVVETFSDTPDLVNITMGPGLHPDHPPADYAPRYMVGMHNYVLNDEPVSDERGREVIAAMLEQLR
jgi:hypothetical protein